MRDNLNSPEDERAHQNVAQLAVGLDKRQDIVALEIDHFAVITRADAGEAAPAGENIHFAGELAGPKSDNERFGRA